MGGKPNKCTPERQERLIELVRQGSFREAACHAVGIGSQSLRNWLAKADQGDERYVEFARRLREAEAHVENDCVFTIKSLGSDDWRALAWYLEKRFPNRFGDVRVAKVQLEREREALFEALHAALTELGMEDAIEHVLRNVAERGEEAAGAAGSGAAPTH